MRLRGDFCIEPASRAAERLRASADRGSDLVAVHFPTPQLGWAVGHDETILNTVDGGENVVGVRR